MTFSNTKFRIFGYLTIGIIHYLMLSLINPFDYEFSIAFLLEMLSDLFVTLIGVIMIMELGFLISKKLDIYLPWRSSLTIRILVQLLVQIVLVSLTLGLLVFFIPDLFSNVTEFRQTFVTGLTLSVLFSAICTAGNFFMQWNQAAVELAKYEQKVARAELEYLKMQINPHFLFNNFSTLSSLIEDEPELAVEYVQRLSNIYRYVLKDEEQHVVTLRDELSFIRSYLFLYQTRYQDSLVVDLDISEIYYDRGIATATMQLLVENAIKHNSISRQNPLRIEIFIEQDSIVIRNNLNPLVKPVESSGIGLKNISDRYLLLSGKEITISQSESYFSVKVPLLNR